MFDQLESAPSNLFSPANSGEPGSEPFEFQMKFGIAPYNLCPHSVYFFYARINEDGRIVVNHYLYSNGAEAIESSSLPQIIHEMAVNARPSGQDDPRFVLIGKNFENVKFDRISYVVFFLDEQHWKFQLNAAGQPVIKFLKEKDGTPRAENWSFSDLTRHPLAMPIRNRPGETSVRDAASLVNHMRDADGELLGDGPPLQYGWDIWTRAAFADAEDGDPGIIVIFDPGGNNQGPPQPPPAIP
jgi:hypothetical protein